MPDRSLDEFFDHTDADASGDVDEQPADHDSSERENGSIVEESDEGSMVEENVDGSITEQSVAGATDEESVEPAQSTSAWAGDGDQCEDCGATVERRWIRDERLVCLDCKDW